MGLITKLRLLRLKNRDFTLFANNCIAGFIYKRYGLKFLTPTINVGLRPFDFIKFCNNYKYYLSKEVEETHDFPDDWLTNIDRDKMLFPVGKIDDIFLWFQHAKTFEEAKRDWDRRKTRINENNIFIILYDVDYDINVFKEFEKIKTENKLYLYHKGERIDSKYAFYIKDFDYTKRTWWSRMNKLNPFSKRYFEQFDYTEWFNKGKK